MAESFLNRNIKELLTEYPALGELLNAYQIGCVTCSVGTCQLNDIVKFHSLPDDQLQDLMHRLAVMIDPDGESMPLPSPAPVTASVPREIKYSPPMQSLVQEHTLIKRFLALIPVIVETIDLEAEADRQLIRDGVDFIRSYADKFHHAKEEDILFKRFDENQAIIRVMYEDHTTGRAHVRGMLAAVEGRDTVRLTEHLLGYRELLCQHIQKEDEILYPWMDRQLTMGQVGELFRDFDQADSQVDPGMAQRYEAFIERLEHTLKGTR